MSLALITVVVLSGCTGENKSKTERASKTIEVSDLRKELKKKMEKSSSIDIELKSTNNIGDEEEHFYIKKDTEGNIIIPGFVENKEVAYEQYFVNNKMYYYIKKNGRIYQDSKITASKMKKDSKAIRKDLSSYFFKKLNICVSSKDEVKSKKGKYVIECSEKEENAKIQVKISIDQETYEYKLEEKYTIKEMNTEYRTTLTYKKEPKKRIKLPKADHGSISEFNEYYRKKKEEQNGTKEEEPSSSSSETYVYSEATPERSITGYATALGYFPKIMYISDGNMYVDRAQIKGTITKTIKAVSEEPGFSITYGIFNGEDTSGDPIQVVMQLL